MRWNRERATLPFFSPFPKDTRNLSHLSKFCCARARVGSARGRGWVLRRLRC